MLDGQVIVKGNINQVPEFWAEQIVEALHDRDPSAMAYVENNTSGTRRHTQKRIIQAVPLPFTRYWPKVIAEITVTPHFSEFICGNYEFDPEFIGEQKIESLSRVQEMPIRSQYNLHEAVNNCIKKIRHEFESRGATAFGGSLAIDSSSWKNHQKQRVSIYSSEGLWKHPVFEIGEINGSRYYRAFDEGIVTSADLRKIDLISKRELAVA